MDMKLDWHEGEPDKREPGMVICDEDGGIYILGHITADDLYCNDVNPQITIKRWAWLIKPYQLEWLQDMAKRDKK